MTFKVAFNKSSFFDEVFLHIVPVLPGNPAVVIKSSLFTVVGDCLIYT